MPERKYRTRTCCRPDCPEFYIELKLLEKSDLTSACIFEPRYLGHLLTQTELRGKRQKCKYGFPLFMKESEFIPAYNTYKHPKRTRKKYENDGLVPQNRLQKMQDLFEKEDRDGQAGTSIDASEVLEDLGVNKRLRDGESIGEDFDIPMGQ